MDPRRPTSFMWHRGAGPPRPETGAPGSLREGRGAAARPGDDRPPRPQDQLAGARLTRRSVLLALALGWATRGLAAGPTPRRSLLRRRIPGSGEELPVVGLGTWQTFDVGDSDAARAPLRAVLRGFVDGGGAVVDSSPMYGRSEEVLGELAAELGVQDRLFHATKVWTRGRQDGIQQMERSFRRMRVPVMDLMQVHNLVDWRTHLDTLRRWKEEGRVRYVGVTHYRDSAHDELAALIRGEDIDFVQLNFSIASRAAEAEVLPLAGERGVAVLVNRPFEGGDLFARVRGRELPPWAADFDCASWGQFFLKYILSEPNVTCVIPATSDPRHLADNMGAGRGALPDADTRRRMVEHLGL